MIDIWGSNKAPPWNSGCLPYKNETNRAGKPNRGLVESKVEMEPRAASQEDQMGAKGGWDRRSRSLVISWQGASLGVGRVPQAGLAQGVPTPPCLDFMVSWQFSDGTLASHVSWHQEGDSLSTRHKSFHGKGMLLYVKEITFWMMHQYPVNLINGSPSLWAWPGQDHTLSFCGQPLHQGDIPQGEPAWMPQTPLEISVTDEQKIVSWRKTEGPVVSFN